MALKEEIRDRRLHAAGKASKRSRDLRGSGKIYSTVQWFWFLRGFSGELFQNDTGSTENRYGEVLPLRQVRLLRSASREFSFPLSSVQRPFSRLFSRLFSDKALTATF